MAASRLSPDRFGKPSKRLAGERRRKNQPESLWIRQKLCERGAQQPLVCRPPVGLLDMGAGMVDEVHVVHARGTRRHAGQAGQAAIDMQRDLGRGRPVILQHVLDEVDASAWRIELVAVEHVGRAGGGAKAAMHASPQDLFRFGDVRIGELSKGEGRLHTKLPPTSGRD